ncbi:MAG TPA: hypothetical protein PK728_03435 [Bacillota bacterium]|nr:hypothetical protein [Bacillota bacterium]
MSVNVPDEPVARVLELQSRYGIDQETMLLYMSSVNLMSILSLISRRYQGAAYNPHAAALPAPALPPLTTGGPQGGNLSLDNVMGMLMKMFGSGNAPGGQGLNPAALMSLLSALVGQNLDLGKIFSMLGNLTGSGVKAPPATEEKTQKPSAPAEAAQATPDLKNAGEEKAVKREVPKIMKWDQLDDRKKA